jgi:hypothetical protein
MDSANCPIHQTKQQHEIDIHHLAEEIESMGASERSHTKIV